MFGGIVETVGVVKARSQSQDCLHFTIAPELRFDDLKVGDSVAVNGVCLTATVVHAAGFDCTAVPETLALTNLSQLTVGSPVNLERALKASDRIGGHHVQGHVDGLGEITAIQDQGAAWLVTLQVAATLARYIVKKGYITLDGMSITIVEAGRDQFSVTLIPHTQQVTIASGYRVGSKLNVEVDILGKYAEKLLEAAHDSAHAFS